MTNTHLLEIIRTIQPSQRTAFSTFLDSTLFNNGPNAHEIRRLNQAILETAPDFHESKLTKEMVYARVFSDSNMVQGKLEKRIMELNRLLRIFLLTRRYLSEKNETQQQLDWLSWLREAGMDARAKASLSKMKSQSQTIQNESLERYRFDLLIAEEEHELQSLQNQFNGDLNIPNLIQSLDLYYQNYRIELLNRYVLQQKGLPLPNLEEAIPDPAYYQEASLLFDISSKIRELLKKDHPSPEEFQHLLRFLQEKEQYLPFQTQTQLFVYLRNLCTLLINGGKLEFASLLHQIHLDNLERGLFYIQGEISPHSYMNIVQIAIRVKEFSWAKEFTEANKKRIIGGDKDRFFYCFNLSHCLFEEGNFDEALAKLPEPSSHSHYHRIIRRLELKIYYELRSDLLHYKMYAFRKYFERTAAKSIPANLRAMHIEFFNILLQLSQSPSKDRMRSQRLMERIQKKKLLADRAWLLEKARDLG